MINAAFILGAEHFDDVYGAVCVERIARQARVLGPTPLSAEELIEAPPPWLSKLDVMFTGWGSPLLDARLLERMPRLRAVFYGAGTLRFLITEACWERDLVIANAAAVNAIPTAEFALGAILLSFKRAWRQAEEVRQQRTFPARPIFASGGRDGRVGLVSLGLVGRRVAEQLRALGMTPLAHDPYLSESKIRALGAIPVSLPELFADADIVSLHTPLVPETTGFIAAPLLRTLKPGATLINTARGALVNEADLVALLRARPDVQAIVDVTDPEPPPPESPLYDLSNLFLTPHIAGSLGSECRRMGELMVEEFERWMRGEPLRHAVAREELARRA